MNFTPKKWQEEAIDAWRYNIIDGLSKGTIKAPTGTGKTIVGIIACHTLCLSKTIVVTPTINLKEQWEEELKDNNIKADVVVINTARKNPEYFKNYDFVILDEIHHYASTESRVIFEHLTNLHILGLSATPERQDKEHVIFEHYAPMVYEYKFREALENEDIAKFEIKDIQVNYLGDKIQRLTERIKQDLQFYNYDIKKVSEAIYYGDWKQKKEAANLMRRIQYRKKLLFNCPPKNDMATKIISKHLTDKIMVFTEMVDSAFDIKDRLLAIGIKSYLYYSVGKKLKMGKKERKENLENFKNDKYGILIAVKALDEGINIPSANIGIIVSGTSVTRQFIQRLGRILRPQKNKKAILYQVYVPNTKDEVWAKKRSTSIKQEINSVNTT